MKIYGLFDKVDGEFKDSLNIFPDDEKAAIGLAKTFAFSNALYEEFEMRCLGDIDEKTGVIIPCPGYVVDMNEEVYERASRVFKARDTLSEENKVEGHTEQAS